MKLIGITGESILPQEAEWIECMLVEGVDFVHLRKPNCLSNELKNLLNEIPTHYHSRLVLHDHFDLCTSYAIGGLHINRRNNCIPSTFQGAVSQSCHSLAQLQEPGDYRYRFLSPIYDSITKKGYTAAFSKKELHKAANEQIINNTTIALGGISLSNMDEIWDLGFGGIALLGTLWNQESIENLRQTIHSFVEYKNK